MHAPPPYPTIYQKLAAGQVIPFLGAGASSGVRAADEAWQKGSATLLPFAGELAAHLATATALPDDVPRDLPAIAHYYYKTVGRDSLDGELREIFSGSPPLRRHHELLAEIETPQLIVTTNYDDLIERALRARKRPFDLVVQTVTETNRLLYQPHRKALARVSPRELDEALLEGDRTLVYKIHGTVVRDVPGLDEYVITEGDYLDFLTRMTRGKLVPAPIGEKFATRHFLFLGYGLRDWNVRILLNQLRPYLRRQKALKIASWAIDEKPSVVEQKFWDERGVLMYGMKLDEFADALAAAA
jgi:hypothetical protein